MRISWPLLLRRVHGQSMMPALLPGALLLGYRWARKYRPGDVVVLRFDQKEMVKRIEQLEDGRVFVLGDNSAASTDSRQFGAVPRSTILAKVIYPRTPRQMV